MKKLFYLAFSFVSFTLLSQEYGLKGGVNIGKEKITDSGVSINSSANFSFLAGFYSDFPVNDQLSVSPEIIYHVDGAKFNILSNKITDRLSYISIPLMFKFNATDRFNLHAGPQLGFLLKAESEINGLTINSTSNVKSTNLSFGLGAEVGLDGLNMGIRYVLGLSNISDNTDATGNIKLNTLQIYVGFPF